MLIYFGILKVIGDQKELFLELLDDHVNGLQDKYKSTFCFTQDIYEKALLSLDLVKSVKCDNGSKFKFWVTKQFKAEHVSSRNVLYCQKTSLPVVTKEDMCDVIKRCHERVGHSGRQKTWDEVRTNYAGIRHDVIQLFLKTCPPCNIRKPLKSKPAGKPIISHSFLSRVQIDLIDMSSRPDENYKWILHMRDYFSKFSWAFPLESKSASGVAKCLVNVFSFFGPPKILQSDNRKEFVANVIKSLQEEWQGLIIIIGRPRHPQSQGCVSRGNGDLQINLLGKWLDDDDEESWVSGLKYVVYSINTSTAAATGKTPYEIVFGQHPCCHLAELEILAEQGQLDEENLDTGIIENENNQSTSELQLSDSNSIPEKDMTPTQCDKRSHEYELLSDGVSVAKGTLIKNRTSVHGVDISNGEGVFIINSVQMPDFVPPCGNSFNECIKLTEQTLMQKLSLAKY